jgi:hypothetical protein
VAASLRSVGAVRRVQRPQDLVGDARTADRRALARVVDLGRIPSAIVTKQDNSAVLHNRTVRPHDSSTSGKEKSGVRFCIGQSAQTEWD